MKKRAYRVTIVSIVVFLFMTACSTKDIDDTINLGNLTLELTHTTGDGLFSLGETYINESQENYSIEEFKYILSNIRLTKADGSEYRYPVQDSYFLIDETNESSKDIILDSIPAGDYTEITFGFGIDPTRYPIASGTLNFVPQAEEAGMLWTWSAGYKFLKMEGNFTSTDQNASNPYLFHVGSHGANLDNYREITLSLRSNTDEILKIDKEETAYIPIFFAIKKIIDGVHTLRIEDQPDIQVDPINAPKLSDNIQAAFSLAIEE